MKRLFIASTVLIATTIFFAARISAQSMNDINFQVHGYATQGFLYSTNNNWDTTDSTDGSAAWTEAVVNLAAEPAPRLRIGVQARYLLLGSYGNAITLDWAHADFKVNEHFGLRAGKVKTPVGLLNETQDIDPSMLWVLLPQSVYPIADRNSNLAHYGGVVYGQVPVGERFGKLEYRAFGGERVIGQDDATFQLIRDQGATVPNGSSGRTFGGTLRWNTPTPGLLVGASENSGSGGGEIDYTLMLPDSSMPQFLTGTLLMPQFRQTFYFARYEHNRIMLGGEYSRYLLSSVIQFPGIPAIHTNWNQPSFYVMASYKMRDKLTGGLYYSSAVNREVALGPSRYQKDWALAARYDFSPYLYFKFEQHVMDGTLVGYSMSDNANLRPNARMTLLKLGVSF